MSRRMVRRMTCKKSPQYTWHCVADVLATGVD